MTNVVFIQYHADKIRLTVARCTKRSVLQRTKQVRDLVKLKRFIRFDHYWKVHEAKLRFYIRIQAKIFEYIIHNIYIVFLCVIVILVIL